LRHGNRARGVAFGAAEGGKSLEDGGNVSQAAARLLALELYREDTVSLERAAALCQAPLAAFMEFAAQHGVPPLRYNHEDLDQERRSTDHVKT
jgi:predicted HTH domain antitoxin